MSWMESWQIETTQFLESLQMILQASSHSTKNKQRELSTTKSSDNKHLREATYRVLNSDNTSVFILHCQNNGLTLDTTCNHCCYTVCDMYTHNAEGTNCMLLYCTSLFSNILLPSHSLECTASTHYTHLP